LVFFVYRARDCFGLSIDKMSNYLRVYHSDHSREKAFNVRTAEAIAENGIIAWQGSGAIPIGALIFSSDGDPSISEGMSCTTNPRTLGPLTDSDPANLD
jgi:hypothetical protein